MLRFSFALVPLLVSPVFSGDVGIPGGPECCESSAPRDVKIPDSVGERALTTLTTNRTLIIQAGGDAECTQQAVRVTFKNLAPRYDPWNGAQLWVGAPELTTEAPSTADPTPGFASNYWAKLQCTQECRDDWGTLGDIHVYHEGIVPDSEYEIQLVDCHDPMCSDNESNYSASLILRTSIFGDTIRDCATTPCAPPQGPPMDVIDKLAVVWAYVSMSFAPRKARVDMEPRDLDRIINITDILEALRAFFGLPYPLEPSVTDPCP